MSARAFTVFIILLCAVLAGVLVLEMWPAPVAAHAIAGKAADSFDHHPDPVLRPRSIQAASAIPVDPVVSTGTPTLAVKVQDLKPALPASAAPPTANAHAIRGKAAAEDTAAAGSHAPAASSGTDAGRLTIGLDQAWHFHLGDIANAQLPEFNDLSWTAIELPHTWNRLDGQDGGSDYHRGPSWYRKRLTLPASCVGKRLFLCFDGANLETTLYVNGAWAGHHAGGFSAFTFDVTGRLRIGMPNLIAVQVDNAPAPAVAPLLAPFTAFGGIYRSVRLVATDPIHLTMDDLGSSGVALRQHDVSPEHATVDVIAGVRNDGDEALTVTVRSAVIDAAGHVAATAFVTHLVAAHGDAQMTSVIQLAKPHLWDGCNDPYLHRVLVQIFAVPPGRSVVAGTAPNDQIDQPLGLRFARIDPDQGFFLNGRHLNLHGVGFQQDRLNKGWAISDADQVEDIGLIREMGANFVHLSYYQHPRKTYDLLDQAGILAWAEIPHVVESPETAAYSASCIQQLREMIRQTGNHPSVLCWGVFNAIRSSALEGKLVRALVDVAHAEDPTRMTCGSSYLVDDAPVNHMTQTIGFSKYFGWYGQDWNQFGHWADGFHAVYPTVPVALVDYGAGASVNEHADHPQQPALLTGKVPHPEEYQSQLHEEVWKQLRARPFLWCTSVWSMFDYADDSVRSADLPGRVDAGLVTIDRKIRKDAFYWYKANWSEKPFVYITSRRYFQRATDSIDIKIYSNMAVVDVMVNGVVLPPVTSTDHIFRCKDVTLRSGENIVKASASGRGGICRDHVTWMAP